MGRTNHSYNGMLSAIARKSLPRFTNYAKDTASLSTIFGNEYSTINKRGNDSLTNIISADFDTPEEYIKETNVGPIITLNGDRTVTMTAGEDYTDLGATADGDEEVTVDTSNLDTNAVGTYTVSYSATETRDNVDYTRVENRFVNVVAPESVVPISSWTLKDTISDPYGLNAGFAFDGSASISGDGAWISIGSDDSSSGTLYGHGNVFMYSKNTDITYSKTQDIANPNNSSYRFGLKTKLSRDGNYLCVIQDYDGSGSYFQMFKRTNNTWNSIASSIQFSALVLDVTLSEDATYIVISNNDNVDEVKVYEKSADNTSVTLMTYINPPENSINGANSVSISDNGELLCFGTPRVESDTGNVYVYTRTSSSWSTNPTAVIQGPATGGYFGWDVSMSGDGNFIAVGAPLLDNAYIYKRSGSSWSLSSTINGPSSYAYGYNVSLSQYGDYLAVGSFYASGSFTGDHVWAYYKDDTDVWTLVQTFTGDTGTNFGYDVEISSGGNYILVTADQATANAYVYFGAGGRWVPGYTTVSVTLGDKLQPNVSSLTRGQKYVFDFSQTRGKDFRLSLDGTTELTSGVIEAENTLVYTLLSYFPFPQLYYYSPNTPGIGGSFSTPGVLSIGTIYFDNGILKATNITSLTRDVSNVFYFSSDYGTKIALSTSLNGPNLTDGITSTDTELTVTLPLAYPYSTIFLKSLDTPNIGSELSVSGTLNDGVIYFDNGILKATNITSLTRDVSNVFYFSSDYGTKIALSTSLNGPNLTDGITSTDTELTVTLPLAYPYSTIFLKSIDTLNIGSELSVPDTEGTIYFDGDGNLRATNITTLTRGVSNVFYFSSNYGTKIALSTSLNGPNLTDGITSTDTELTVTLPLAYPYSTIFLKSIDTLNIGSELSVPGSLNDGVIYYDGDGNLRATNITTLYRGVSNVFHFSSDYGTSVALSTSLNGANLTEGISNTETSLTVVVPWSFPETIFLKSIDTLNIGSELSVPFPSPVQTSIPTSNPSNLDSNSAETFRSIITGLYAHNDTRQIGSYTFDNRGTTGQDSDTIISYPDLIVQALPGDTITITANVVLPISSSFVSVELWYWYGSGDWIEFHSEQVSSAGYTDVTGELTIPSNKFGNFAIAASTAWNSDYEWNIRKYSLHVIDPDYYL
jgi:hypothetical protein